MGFFLQLKILLWKNFTLRKRQPLRLVVEILWPLCLFLILLAVRFRPDIRELKPECHYYPRAMPSAGTLSFLQSYVCTFSNTCNPNVTEDDSSGFLSSFNSSTLSLVISDVERVLASGNNVEELSRLFADAQLLVNFLNQISNSTSDLQNVGFRLRDVLVDQLELQDQIANQSIALSPDVVQDLLNATVDFRALFNNLNTSNTEEILQVAEALAQMANDQQLNVTNVQMIQDMLCDGQNLLRYVNFGDPTQATAAQSQLCNLTTEQAQLLAQDIVADLNSTALTQEISQIITDVTGQVPSFNTTSLNTVIRVVNDLSNLQSLQFLFDDASAIAQGLSSAVPDTSALSSGDPVAIMSQLLCGRNVRIFGLGGDSDNQQQQESMNDPEAQETTQRGADFEKAKQAYEDSGFTSHCAEQFAGLETTSGGSRVIWNQVKPIVLGVITYTPDSPAAKKIVEEASRFFMSLRDLLNLSVDLQTVIPQVEAFLENDIEPLRDFFAGESCRTLTALAQQVGSQEIFRQALPPQFAQYAQFLPLLSAAGPSLCQTVSTFISRNRLNNTSTWRDTLDGLNSALGSISPYLECFVFDKFKGYPNTWEMAEASLGHIENKTYLTGIVFENIGPDDVELPSLIRYSIRMDTDNVDDTQWISDKYLRPGPRDWMGSLKYFVYWFIYIQDMIDNAIIRLQSNTTDVPGVYTNQMPYPCWIRDRFIFTISRMLPLFMTISWIYSVAMIIKGIVYEKEHRLKEVMKIMGLGNGVHWVAWFISTFVVMLVTVILFVIILKGGKILEYSDPSVVFVFMMGFISSTISQCFLISVFFNKANLAAVCGGFVYFILYLPYTQLVQFEEEILSWHRILACLSSNIAMGYGCSYFSQYEEMTVGAQWNNIGESPMVDDDFSLRICILMMFVDTLIYLLITWYIEAVFPGEYGIPHKPWFFVQKSYWFPNSVKRQNFRIDGEMPVEDLRNDSGNIEPEPTDQRVGVSVRNLRKIYKRSDKIAVDGLTINFFEGQITSFLGHNGAGKTTTMSILTGLFPPTSGTALVYGKDILTDMDSIRNSMGMCPQHNVLFDLLTVEEHIWFYASLKGCSKDKVQAEIEEMVDNVGLPHKRHEKAENLSGGMKRKLSVAIAFVGGSRTVILDEPTAGVDPYARRSIWELLLKFKKDRTIILSTHHMDEADVLGDRIAIISQGKLCTVGSSLFLKNKFGSGYYLTLVRADKEMDDNQSMTSGASGLDSMSLSSRPSTSQSVRTIVEVQPSLEPEDEGYSDKAGSDRSDSPSILPLPSQKHKLKTLPGYSLARLTAVIQKFVPGAVLVEENSMEVCFRLPESDGHAEKFQKLFESLELTHRDMGISSYGISDTSLEEVFLKVADDTMDQDNEEVTLTKLEEMSDNGRYPRPVSKMSARKAKTSMFKLNFRNRVNSTERLQEAAADDDVGPDDNKESMADLNFSGAGRTELSGKRLVLRQFLALFIKRFHHVRRSKKGFVSEVILPAGFVCLAMVFSLILPPFTEMPSLELQPWRYEPSKGDSHLYTFYSNVNSSNLVAQKVEATLLSSPYYGTRCMNSSIYSISDYPCLKGSTPWSYKMSNPDDFEPVACSCASGFQSCPAGAEGPEPPMRTLEVKDRFYNVSGRNLSDWLVKSVDSYKKRRYGGFTVGLENPLGRFNVDEIRYAINNLSAVANGSAALPEVDQLLTDLGAVLSEGYTKDNVKVWFNNKGWMASVAYMNAMNNVLLRSMLSSDKDPHNYGIVTYNYPMNLTKQQLNEETIRNSFVDVIVSICVIFAMSFVPASFVLFLIEERVSNSKHLQFVSGINPTVYWVATWAWDMINYCIPAFLCIIIFLAFGKEAYVSAKNFPCLLALMLLYGWSITPMMYPFSRLFNIPSSAFVALSCVNVFLGTVSTLATFILEALAQEDPELGDINVILKQVFLVLPHYCLGRGLIDMAAYQLRSDVFTRFAEPLNYDLFEWNIVGRNLFAMFFCGVGFNLLNWLIEYRFFLSWACIARNPSSKVTKLDVDVEREKHRVKSGGAEDDILRIVGLTKVYWTPGKKGKMTAVDNIYVGVPKSQCFGLLGVNGAGKTTTFKMLTGDVNVTKGDAFVNNFSIGSDMVSVRRHIGYCPQFDALDPLLTGRETLEFYARVRGIDPGHVKPVADWAIKKLGLIRYADKITSDYSGGNKRKLSTAIALIGNPPIIFLDEPTTGMDPKARRFLWNCINNIVKGGRSVILTSHSMEECEALCSRLAIMVNGNFQCIGSIQHLKNRFGNGYTIILRVSGTTPNLEPVMEYITSSFPSAELREKHHNMVQYQLGSDNLSLSSLFAAMEKAKKLYGVEDYSVSQTTLDQVFINFAKLQTDLKDNELDERKKEENADDDNLSRLYRTDSFSTGVPTDLDDQSLTGSTAGLIHPHRRHGTRVHGNRVPHDKGELSNVSIAL